MGDRKRPHEQRDKFLNSHFSSGGKLAVEESVRASGPEALKDVILGTLKEGETVTRSARLCRTLTVLFEVLAVDIATLCSQTLLHYPLFCHLVTFQCCLSFYIPMGKVWNFLMQSIEKAAASIQAGWRK